MCDGPGHSEGCQCPALKRLYGPRLYHCKRAFCSAYTSGFETKPSLMEHIGVHSTSHRCHFPGCLFADTGFRSSDDLSRHIKYTHEAPDMPDFSIGANEVANLPENDQVHLLYDAVASGRFDVVRHLASSPVLAKAENLITLAGWNSPPDLLSWLLNHDYYTKKPSTGGNDINTALHAAIEGENLPNIKALLSCGADITSQLILKKSRIDVYLTIPKTDNDLKIGLFRALRRWNGALMKFLVEECGVTLPHTWGSTWGHLSAIFEAAHLSEASLEDARRRFSAIQPYIPWTEAYPLGPAYAVLAQSPALVRISLENGGDPNKSISDWHETLPLHDSVKGQNLQITELLLEYKANPNAITKYMQHRFHRTAPVQRTAVQLLSLPRSFGESASRSNPLRMNQMRLLLSYGADPNIGNDALYNAVRWGAAEMVKLLLQHGADPGRKRPDRLAGMKKIEKYFGNSWKDIVQKIQSGEELEGRGGRAQA